MNAPNQNDTIIKFYAAKATILKSNPDVLSETITTIPQDSIVIISDTIEDWYQVKYSKSEGYLPKTKLVMERTIQQASNEIVAENTSYFSVEIFVSLGLLGIILFLFLRLKKVKNMLGRYVPIIDIEDRVKEIQEEIKKQEEIKIRTEGEIKKKKEDFELEYKGAKRIYEKLKSDLSLYEESLENFEFGMYNPTFTFDTSEKFKEVIKNIKNGQKALIKEKNACYSTTEWEVNGSKREGNKLVNKQVKLTLKAFNSICDTLISNVNWNNANRYIERIRYEAKQLNKMNETSKIILSDQFIDMKIHELRMTQEYREKKYLEKEIAREERAKVREEERARREYEEEIRKAEKEQKMFLKALEEARKQLGLVSEEKMIELQNNIEDLERQLKETQEKAERATSMAQLTKRGHIYIISNIGSFGEGIYKIGMTRRLDPFDRVNELGDASVPFKFDVHAIIKSDNAPELESQLHSHFNNRRVNKVNLRREYFKVSIEEIEEYLKEHFDEEYDLVIKPEAREYRESFFLENPPKDSNKSDREDFPESLFD